MTSEQKRIIFQVALFIATFITTTLAGAEWVFGRSILYHEDFGWTDFVNGMQFSVPLLLILTVHEFGHYFTALYHKVAASLPYYIPIPPIPYLPLSIGTLGAVIRLRTRPASNVQHFDIGVAGPVAGFIVAIALLFYGLVTLPPADYIYKFHPEYEEFGSDYAAHVYNPAYMADKKVLDIELGQSLMFVIAAKVAGDPARFPNPHELMHYPVLFAVFIGLLVTSMNLLPIGQLDGGHILYGLFGAAKHKVIAGIFFVLLISYAGIGLEWIRPQQPPNVLMISIPVYLWFLFTAFRGFGLSTRDTIMLAVVIFGAQFAMMEFFPRIEGYSGWLVFAFVIGRFVGIQHPPSAIEVPLDAGRKLVGWFALLIFVLCFIPAPLVIR